MLPSSHRHLLEPALWTTLFSWGVRKPDLELQVLRKRGHNYKRASLHSFINEGCEAKKARPSNPSRGEGQLSGRGWKRWGKESNALGGEEWPGSRHSARRRQGKNSPLWPDHATRRGNTEEKELKRLAKARPCKTFTIELGLTTRAVVWTQGAVGKEGHGPDSSPLFHGCTPQKTTRSLKARTLVTIGYD